MNKHTQASAASPRDELRPSDAHNKLWGIRIPGTDVDPRQLALLPEAQESIRVKS